MSTYKVEICGVNTAQLPILKEEEKEELFKKIKAGDKASRETYIKGNLRLVLSVIKRFNNHNENVDDLFQIGCIGLMKAIDNFDTSVGVKFSTYAVPMIIGEIRRYLRDNSSYRIPRSLRDIAYKAMQAKERLAKNAQKEPTLEEIAAECEIPVEDVVYALDAIQTPLSLFDPVYTDGGDTLYVMDLAVQILDYTKTASMLKDVTPTFDNPSQEDIDKYANEGRIVDVTLGNNQLVWGGFQEENAKDIAAWLQGDETFEECLKASDERVKASSAN